MIIINKFDNFTNFDYKGLSQILISLSPQEMTLLAGIIGTLCTFSLSSSELNVLGNFLQSIGQLISLAQAQKALQEQTNNVSINDLNKVKQELDYKINYLYQSFKKNIK